MTHWIRGSQYVPKKFNQLGTFASSSSSLVSELTPRPLSSKSLSNIASSFDSGQSQGNPRCFYWTIFLRLYFRSWFFLSAGFGFPNLSLESGSCLNSWSRELKILTIRGTNETEWSWLLESFSCVLFIEFWVTQLTYFPDLVHETKKTHLRDLVHEMQKAPFTE